MIDIPTFTRKRLVNVLRFGPKVKTELDDKPKHLFNITGLNMTERKEDDFYPIPGCDKTREDLQDFYYSYDQIREYAKMHGYLVIEHDQLPAAMKF